MSTSFSIKLRSICYYNGFRLSGVQDLNGSYNIQKTPINILGQGHCLYLTLQQKVALVFPEI